MRQRIDISLSTKSMLATIKDAIGTYDTTLSEINEMCVLAAYDKILNNDCFSEELNPTQSKLDEIILMLQVALPEV